MSGRGSSQGFFDDPEKKQNLALSSPPRHERTSDKENDIPVPIDKVEDLSIEKSAIKDGSDEEVAKPAHRPIKSAYDLPPEHPMHPDQFPEGGPGWLVVAGGFFVAFVTFGWVNCIGVFQDYYSTHFLSQYSQSTISWISSVEAFMLFVGGPVIGKVFDNFGPRYLLIGGTFFHVFGIMMTSLSTKYYQIMLAQAICSPLGASCLFYPATSCVSTWFFKRRALAMGIFASGSSLGGVLLPIAVFKLFPEVGFPWTMRIIGFIFLALCTFAIFTVRSRFPPRRTPFAPLDFVRPLKEGAFALNAFASFVTYLPLLVPINFVTISAARIGMSRNLQNYVISILNAASLFGRIFPGWAADKLGRFNLQIACTALTGIASLAIWIPANTNAVILLFAAFYGFASGAFVSLAPAIVAQITTDLTQIGIRNGTTFFILSFGSLIGNPIGGALNADYGGGFLGVQLFCGILQLSGAVLFFITKGYVTNWRWFSKY